jgi:hypothetical protein
MSTDIAVPTAGADALYLFVQNAQAVAPIANSLSNTAFVPTSMRGKPAEICACILTGAELDMKPMASLRSIDIIDGSPTLRAVAMRGLVQSKGHEVWVEESTMTVAVVCGQRLGSDHVQKSVWTIERARQAGLVGKRNWVNNPTAMLVARATAEVCRLIAADVLMAMPYSSEEIRDAMADPEPAPADANQPDSAPLRIFRRDPLPEHEQDNGPDDLGDAVQAQDHPKEIHDKIAVNEGGQAR